MKIIAIQPRVDRPARHNYQVNYCLWDAMEEISEFSRFTLEDIGKKPLPECDVFFLPMNIRWFGHEKQLKLIKKLGKPMIMFDNDDLRRHRNDPLYDGMTYIFSRVHDREGKIRPIEKGAWYPWAVNSQVYTPVYGGTDICMPASIKGYPIRKRIVARHSIDLNLSRKNGANYIHLLQKSRALIATGSDICRVTRSKVLEAARCGCLLITEKTEYLDRYFPMEMVFAFRKERNVGKLIHHVKLMKPEEVIHKQQQLANHAAQYHDARKQAAKMLCFIGELLQGRLREEVLRTIQYPMETPINA